MDFSDKKQRFSEKLSYQSQLYFNRLNQLQKDCNKLVQSVKENKNWLNEKHPVLQEHLNHFQFLLQERTIGFFGDLVSTATQDILEKDDRIVFDLKMERQMPSLNIFAQSGALEEITSGGMINVIATALRSLVLWRVTHTEKHSHQGAVKHRKFLFLDEPDCWIYEKAIPNYARFLYELSEHFGIQIVMVSHKNIEYFKPYARVYDIQKPAGNAEVNIISDIPYDAQKHQDYISSIYLRNIKSFRNTLIELHPQMTVISGQSHVGKSVIIEAFKAMIHNESADTLIRHGENQALVQLEILEADKKYALCWERVRQTDSRFPQKVRYTKMIDNQGKWEKLNEEYESKQTPDFARQLLKMDLIGDVEVHLGFQSDMDFLFDKRASGTQRAKLLSLGKETDMVYQAMKKLKQKKQDLSSEIRYKEKEYNHIIGMLENLPNIDETLISDKVSSLKRQEERISVLQEQTQDCQALLEQWDKIDRELTLLNQTSAFIRVKTDKCDKIHADWEKLGEVLQYHDETHAQIKVLAVLDGYKAIPPVSEQTQERCRHIQTLIADYDYATRGLTQLKALKNYTQADVPDYQSISSRLSGIIQMGKQLKSIGESLQKTSEECEKARQLQKQMAEHIHDLEQQMGVCPCCQRVF